ARRGDPGNADDAEAGARRHPGREASRMKPVKFAYERPGSLDEALRLLAEHAGRARLLAGGQSLGPMLNLRLATPEMIIDIGRLWGVERAGTAHRAVGLGARGCPA